MSVHRFIRRSCIPLLPAFALLFTILLPGTASAYDSDFVKEIAKRYDQLEKAETKLYEETLSYRTKEFEALLQQAGNQQKVLEQAVKADQAYLDNIFTEDLKLMENKYGNDSKYSGKLRDYERQSDPDYSSGAMWKYARAADKDYSSSVHWSFDNQIDPDYSSGAMWKYQNNIDPDYSSSIMWKYSNTVDPDYSSSTMWGLHNAADPDYSSSPMWSYTNGRLSKASAQTKMDDILAEGLTSLQNTRQETTEKLDALRDETIARVTEARDHAVKTILDNRNSAVQKLMDLRKELLGETVATQPLILQFEPLTVKGVTPGGSTAETPSTSGIKVIIDGEVQSFEQSPVMISGNTLVPMRAIFERLGAEMKWNATERSVTATKGETTVYLKINSKEASIGKKTIQLPIGAQIVRSNTMVPLRFVGEALGADVKWEAAAQTVVITTVKAAA